MFYFDIPVSEVIVDHTVWKSFATNTDAFKYTITGQLMHYKVGINQSCLFVGVRDHTSEIRLIISKNIR